MTHGGNVELLAPQYGLEVKDLLDFSANINPYGPPPGTKELFGRFWQEISRYPDPHSTHLRSALSFLHQVDPATVCVANGASELIYWIARLWHMPKALIFGPTFTEYAAAVLSAKGSIHYEFAGEQDGFRHRFPEDIGQANLVFVGNPNNPTGNLYTAQQLQTWVQQVQSKNPDTFFVIDESFLAFQGNESQLSLVQYAVTMPAVIVLRSLTKIFSVPGLRLGYMISHPELARALEKLMPTWRVNILAQRFGEKISSYSQFLERSRSALKDHREEFLSDLRQVPGLKIFDSAANFFLVKFLSLNLKSSEVTDRLAGRGILVRCCDDFEGLEKERFIRLAVRKPDQNKIVAQAIREICRA